MIDRSYFVPRPAVYFRDLLIPLIGFAAAFAWCANASGWQFVLAFVVAAVSIHRAGTFFHEVAHRLEDRRLRPFNLFWDMTVGAIALIPAARFVRPHMIHHSTGKFRTRADAQYLLMRGDWKLTAFLFIVIPPVMPIVYLVATVASALGSTAFEEAVDRFVQDRDMGTGNTVPLKYQRRVMHLSRYYLALWAAYAALLPETLPLLYSVLAAGWYLATWRLPLEHRMESRLATSDKHDQMVDSFTVESPYADLLQPLALKYHTAHHLYPGVPYHNLPALHAELKATDPDYRRSVVSYRDILRGVPEPERSAAPAA